jgi:uncharacterized membrane protein
MNRIEIKNEAKKRVKDNKWILWKPILVIFAISFIVGFAMESAGIEEDSYLNIFATIFVLPLSVGLIKYYLDFYRNKKLDWREMFKFYNKIIPMLVIYILVLSMITIGMVLLIVPGIILSMMFAMVFYLLADGEEEIIETIKKSCDMMKGHKMDFFVLNLSFIGWMILSCLTFGILFIWVIPYIQMSQIIFYEKLKHKK